jgi:hypothetical protein
MNIVDIAAMARRLGVYLALLLLFSVFAHPTYSQNSEPCRDAQVIAIQGKWVANPGAHALSNWSCVSAGQEIVLANDSLNGLITIIYHQGGMSPHTVRCKSRAECRNAYRVEAPPARTDVPRSPFEQIVDFFFSIFHEGESQPVKGILQGEIYTRPRPALTCSFEKTVDLEDILKPGSYKVTVMALNEPARAITWQAKSAMGSPTYTGAGWGALVGAEGSSNHTSLEMAQPLREPALYAVVAQPVGTKPPISVWMLIAPETLCKPLSNSYDQAVAFTKTWPKDTPIEAATDFRLGYLQSLAEQPDKAPQGKTQR